MEKQQHDEADALRDQVSNLEAALAEDRERLEILSDAILDYAADALAEVTPGLFSRTEPVGA